MLELLDYLAIFALNGLSLLLGAWIGFRYLKPRVKRAINGYSVSIGNRIKKEMTEFASGALEDLDIGALSGALGGGEDASGGLGALTGILGGSSGGLGDLLSLLGQFSGKQTTKGKGKIGL